MSVKENIFKMSSRSSSPSDQSGRSAPSSFLWHLSAGERELDKVLLDHCYSKNWSTHPGASHARPGKMLFVPRTLRMKDETSFTQSSDSDPVLIVDDQPPTQEVLYDMARARTMMNECERHVNFARTNPNDERTDEDWEEKLSRDGWTPLQHKLFNKMLRHLQADRLARLAIQGNHNEPVFCRIYVDKCAKMVRKTLGSIGWEARLTQWLHVVLVDNLSNSLLASYLNVLQCLRSKIPTLIDGMMGLKQKKGSNLSPSSEALNLLLKRPWDPAVGLINQHKPGKLPGSPLLVMAPHGPNKTSVSQSRRMRLWNTQLAGLGKLIPVTLHSSSVSSSIPIAQCLENMITAMRTKITELRSQYTKRPIILVGWSIGAIIASYIASQEDVAAIVCLGFPVKGLQGYRGDLDDPLFECKTPMLFVVGQESTMCNTDELENLRERMKAVTGLVIVGGADEKLRMTKTKKKAEGVTQSMVDRCIMDEISEFLTKILTSSNSERASSTSESSSSRKRDKERSKDKKEEKKRKVQRDLYNELKGRKTPPVASGMKKSSGVSLEGISMLPPTPKSAKQVHSQRSVSSEAAAVPSVGATSLATKPSMSQATTATKTSKQNQPLSQTKSILTMKSTTPTTTLQQTSAPSSSIQVTKPTHVTPSTPEDGEEDNSFSAQYTRFLAKLAEKETGKSDATDNPEDPELIVVDENLSKFPSKRRLSHSPTTIRRKQMKLMSLPIITKEMSRSGASTITYTSSISKSPADKTILPGFFSKKTLQTSDSATGQLSSLSGVQASIPRGPESSRKLLEGTHIQIGPQSKLGRPVSHSMSGFTGGSSSQVFTLSSLGSLSGATSHSTNLLHGLRFDVQQGKSKESSKTSGLPIGGMLEGILSKTAHAYAKPPSAAPAQTLQASSSQHAFVQALNSTQQSTIKQPRKPSGARSPGHASQSSVSKRGDNKSSLAFHLITSALKAQSSRASNTSLITTPATTMHVAALPVKTSSSSKSIPSISSEASVVNPLGAQTVTKSTEESREAQVQAIQKLQFHDFPLTTVALKTSSSGETSVYTEAKILKDLQTGAIPAVALTFMEGGTMKKFEIVSSASGGTHMKPNTTLNTGAFLLSNYSPSVNSASSNTIKNEGTALQITTSAKSVSVPDSVRPAQVSKANASVTTSSLVTSTHLASPVVTSIVDSKADTSSGKTSAALASKTVKVIAVPAKHESSSAEIAKMTASKSLSVKDKVSTTSSSDCVTAKSSTSKSVTASPATSKTVTSSAVEKTSKLVISKGQDIKAALPLSIVSKTVKLSSVTSESRGTPVIPIPKVTSPNVVSKAGTLKIVTHSTTVTTKVVTSAGVTSKTDSSRKSAITIGSKSKVVPSKTESDKTGNIACGESKNGSKTLVTSPSAVLKVTAMRSGTSRFAGFKALTSTGKPGSSKPSVVNKVSASKSSKYVDVVTVDDDDSDEDDIPLSKMVLKSESQLPSLSSLSSTRTRKVRAPKQLQDYTELI